MDDLYFIGYKDHPDICARCKHIEWQGCLVSSPDEAYHGYDGTHFCDKSKESGRMCISPCWGACKNCFEAKDADDYKNEMADHILYALEEFEKDPKSCEGKTKQEVICNVLSNYMETLVRFVDDTTEFEYKRIKKNQNTITDGTSSNNNA